LLGFAQDVEIIPDLDKGISDPVKMMDFVACGNLRPDARLSNSVSFKDDNRFRQVLNMGERHMKAADAVFLAEYFHFAVHHRLRFSQFVIDDLDLVEPIAAAPAGAHCLEKRFLGREPGGEVLGAPASRFAVFNLPRGKDARFQAFGPAEFILDAADLDYVSANPENQRVTSLETTRNGELLSSNLPKCQKAGEPIFGSARSGAELRH
jgi:hypothetical protein